MLVWIPRPCGLPNQGQAGKSGGQMALSNANLSAVLTALPSGLSQIESEVEIPQSGAEKTAERPVEHVCQICPTCGARLNSYRCKLVCGQCGYYMSCADYY
jgi:hypothetical protein